MNILFYFRLVIIFFSENLQNDSNIEERKNNLRLN